LENGEIIENGKFNILINDNNSYLSKLLLNYNNNNDDENNIDENINIDDEDNVNENIKININENIKINNINDIEKNNENKNIKKQIIVEEERNKGSISIDLIFQYIDLCGGKIIIFIILLIFFISQLFSLSGIIYLIKKKGII
jgi:ABC-type glutathione transport system ATPase component